MNSPFSKLSCMPVGFRFRPMDEELVDHYLKRKLNGGGSLVEIIPEIDICKVEPWDIPALSLIKSDDPEWYFFSPRDYKYSNSSRCKRSTKSGFWKATGKDRYIKARGTNNVIGTKKVLVFQEGRAPHCVKTSWVIHEYHATTFQLSQRAFVLCRLMKKAAKKSEEGDTLTYGVEPSTDAASYNENQASSDRMPDVYTLPQVNLESIFQAPPQEEEYHLPWIQQSIIDMEQGTCIPSSFASIHFRNANSNVNEEEDNEFFNSIFAD